MTNGYPQGNGGYYSPNMGFCPQPGPTPGWPGYYIPAPPPTPAQVEKKSIRSCGNAVGLTILLYTAVSLLVAGGSYLLIWFLPLSSASSEIAEQVITMVTYLASFILPFGICIALQKMPVRVALPLRRFNGRITLMAIPLSLGVSVAASYLVAMLGALFSTVGVEATAPDFALPTDPAAVVLYVLNVAVLPAFVEEFAFRGVILQSLRRFGDAFAVGVSALLFGLMHMNLVQAPYAILLGLLFGYLTVRTGSLWTAILLHFLNNSISVAFQMLAGGASVPVQEAVNGAYTILCLLLGVLGLLLFLSREKKIWFFRPAGTALSAGRRFAYFFTAAGMIVALIQILLFVVTTLRWVG
ncbi:MAG: CPBP family glutamic-type intramembrane protease [Oscillospiraceae bacterium]|nr:CPBP family glutamic-type intramembrane protease [Oscillospiraceae bacterium]